MTVDRFAFPTTILFGPGARKLVADHLKAQGVKRPLIVTDRGIAPLPMLQSFIADLPGLDAAVYSDIWGNPVASQATRGAKAYKDHRADAVIGLGGGAALDVAKAVALMATHDGDVLEYAWDHPRVRPIEHDLPYFVALPTTSGTGSEVGRSSVVSDDTTHIKKIIFSPKLLARAVFADPNSRSTCPPSPRRRHGRADAQRRIVPLAGLSSAVRRSRRSRTRIAAKSLRTAVREVHNLAARSMMMADDGRDRVPEGPSAPCTRARTRCSTVADLHLGWPTVRDRPCDALPRLRNRQEWPSLAHVVGIHGGEGGSRRARVHPTGSSG
jgi:alcohol dehydrogenase YqhD (iron-dependent ADH family)